MRTKTNYSRNMVNPYKMSYCVKCRTKTEGSSPVIVETKNARVGERSICSTCGLNKFAFIKGGRQKYKDVMIVDEVDEMVQDDEVDEVVVDGEVVYEVAVDEVDEVEVDGEGIQEFIVGKFPNTEFHLPVQRDDGKVVKASFAGPGTNLSKRIRNLEVNSVRGWKGEPIPLEDIITPPVGPFDELAMYHDLSYNYADKHSRSAKEKRQMKSTADITMMKGAAILAAKGSDNKVNLALAIGTVPSFGLKVLGETILGKF